MEYDAKCAARHYGPWMLELGWLQARLWEMEHGVFKPMAGTAVDGTSEMSQPQDGLLTLQIINQMMKGESKYGGTNTLQLRKQVREARRDEDVKGVFLLVDSPGGTAAGTAELADDVRALAAEKPTHAYIWDLGASAAYWVASQANRISANEAGMVGSIGTMAAIVDSSGAAEAEGIKVHVLSTGPYKATGVPGAPISEEQISYLQERVDDMNELFLRAVSNGRLVSMDQVEQWASGKIWRADKAKELGLIDSVSTMEDAAQRLRESIPADAPTKRETMRLRMKMQVLALDLAIRRCSNQGVFQGRAEA